MPVLLALGVALLLGLVFGPQWWVRRVMQQHAAERPDLPGTGGELARHLLDLARLEHVPVEIAPADHYDPVANVVRLSPQNHDGRSITAVAVAAHEVSHALQHAAGDRLLAARVTFAPVVRGFEFAAAVVMTTAPLMVAVVKSPVLLALQVGVGIALLGVRLVFHLLTLPVELDASFRRALPILETGRFLDAGDMRGARTVLRAAALTYVASSLVSLVNIARVRRLLPF
ncbi:zinc metallopeptidase [Methylobacterium radiodurans]|uniref:Peptidase n=1 Tax=Methylobacterium radiodurans TaxID=2202828 RepID=A0A2U8VRF2_9HYPH|nr:zinc metallopeptidase [Methylobacterium radiodurans]AWN35862.1 peptidase [Methylobacterium radiodurans]